jgi:hypothetical protein
MIDPKDGSIYPAYDIKGFRFKSTQKQSIERIALAAEEQGGYDTL